jgi:hypothetical protein
MLVRVCILLVGLLGDFFILSYLLSDVHGIDAVLSIWVIVEFFLGIKDKQKKR